MSAVSAPRNAVTRRDDWGTPPELVRSAVDFFGELACDMAASPENRVCPKYVARETDALSMAHWPRERVWCNPPYVEIGRWAAKMAAEGDQGTEVIALMPVRSSAEWWHRWVIAEAVSVVFLRPKIRFVGAPYNSPENHALVRWSGPRPNTAPHVYGLRWRP